MQLFVDNLTVIDCSYLHPEHGIEGESWICDIALTGALDHQSMIMDFGLVKKHIKRAIDAWVDHCLLVPRQSPHLLQLTDNEQGVLLHWEDAGDRAWIHQSPKEALCVMDVQEITMESVQHYLQTRLMEVVHETVQSVEVALRTEAIAGAYYHYSHGLKKHDGNCQRIAHGHRSKLDIWCDGEIDENRVQQWCSKWGHIYLVSQEDITEQNDTFIRSEYDAPQGYFMLQAPADACDVIACDSTVECIAQYIADSLKQLQPDAVWKVKAYEGVQKGAIVSA